MAGKKPMLRGAMELLDAPGLDRLVAPFVREVGDLFHVGRLDQPPPERRSVLYPSRGLFVSQHPEAWTEICKLGGYPTWSVRRRDGREGRFLDWLQVPEAVRGTIHSTAVARGLLQVIDLFEVRRFDDELGYEYALQFESHAEAVYEVDGDEEMVSLISGYGATDKLVDIWGRYFWRSRPEPSSAVEFASELLLESNTDVDGIWWDEDLDPARLSAPQGVIFHDRLAAWRWD